MGSLRKWSAVGALGSLLVVGATVALSACSSSSNGSSSGNPDGGPCPVAAPTIGSACSLANGTICDYGSCTPAYACFQGTWNNEGPSDGEGAAPACPAVVPDAGTYCSSIYAECTPFAQTCTFHCAGGGTRTASCNGEQYATWIVTTSTDCTDDGGAPDSGEDDAGDAGTDSGDGG